MYCFKDGSSIFKVERMDIVIKLRHIFTQLRWNQWIKGFIAFFALLWVPHQWPQYIGLVFAGAMAFNLTSSIVYIINDIFDRDLDQKHPHKKKRPLASGALTLTEVYAMLMFLIGTVFFIMSYINNIWAMVLLSAYLGLNLLYTFYFKHIAYVDILTVSSFAGLRLAMGFVLLNIPIAWYFVILLVSFFLFAMTVQRLAELTTLGYVARPVLKYYSTPMLKLLLTTLLIGTVVLYFMSMALVALPLVFTDVLYFLLLLGVYEYVIPSQGDKSDAEDAYRLLLHHRGLLAIAVLFVLVIATILIMYYL